MITVPEGAKKIVERSRYLTEAISKGLINYSALARYIKPELEEILVKQVSESSIMMALKRLESSFQPKYKYNNIFKTSPEIIVRSNLTEFTINNSEDLNKKISKIFAIYKQQQKYFFTLTEGVSETTIIVSDQLQEKINIILEKEKIITTFTSLSAITIRLPKQSTTTPGIFYFFLKSLAWEGINVLEIVSTYLEFTIIFENKDINRAFIILKSLFS